MLEKVKLPHFALAVLMLLFSASIVIAQNTNDSLLSQSGQHYKNFTHLDGLPSSEVYDITQDNEGYLWFATDRGLARYDGKQFESFGPKDILTANVIFNFFEQADGTIWCSTYSKKLFYFNNASDGFHMYPFNNQIEKNTKKSQTINNIVFSENHTMYLSFVNQNGYLAINKDGVIISNSNNKSSVKSEKDQLIIRNENIGDFIFFDTASSSINDQPILHIAAKEFSELLAYNPRCYWYSKQKKYVVGIGKINLICDENLNVLHKKRFDKVCIYHDTYDTSSYWIGFQYGGAAEYDLDGNLIANYLPEESVTKIFIDHEGGQWFSTLSSGVFYNPAPQIKHYIFENYPTKLAAINKDSLFISFHNGDVILKNEKNQIQLFYESLTNTPSLVNYYKDQRILLFGENGKLLHLDKGNTVTNYFGSNTIFFECSDDQEGKPIFISNSKIQIIEGDEIKIIEINDNLHDITQSKKGIYIAGNQGLYLYSENKLSTVVPENKFLRERIYDVDYRHNALYMATLNSGLVIMQEDTILSINQSNGLLSNNCIEVCVENEHTIWVGTNKGLSRVILYPNNKFDVQSLSIKNGLNCTEINDIEIIEDEVWLTSKEGLFNFNKNFINQSYRDVRKWLEITEIKVNDSAWSNAINEYEFDYLENSISFKFNAVTLKNPEPPHYRYRLVGATNTWTETNANNVNFSQLKPGEYTFELGVLGESGAWSEHTALSFIIDTPFWKAWWFIITILLFIFLIVFIAFRYKLLTFNRGYAKLLMRRIRKLFKRKKTNTIDAEPTYISVKASGKYVKILVKEILYFKSSGNYVEIYTTETRHTVRATLAEIYDWLPENSRFTQLHRSFYVAKEKVTKIGNKSVFINEIEIPVSRTYATNLSAVKF